MLVGIETDLSDIIVHLNQAAIITHEKREKKEDRSVADPFAAIQYREEESGDDQMERNEQLENVEDNDSETGW